MGSQRVRQDWGANTQHQSWTKVDKDSPVLYQNGSILPRKLEVRFSKQLKLHKRDEHHLVMSSMSSKLEATSDYFSIHLIWLLLPLSNLENFSSL